MEKGFLIKQLQNSDLAARCPNCQEKFSLSDAVIFDGLGEFPDIALQRKEQMIEELEKRFERLQKLKKSIKQSENRSISVGIGKIVEKVLPAHKDFQFTRNDCRPLFEPIDMIVFDGVSKLQVNYITFLEIKTGESRLGTGEKAIKHAVEDKKLEYKEIE